MMELTSKILESEQTLKNLGKAFLLFDEGSDSPEVDHPVGRGIHLSFVYLGRLVVHELLSREPMPITDADVEKFLVPLLQTLNSEKLSIRLPLDFLTQKVYEFKLQPGEAVTFDKRLQAEIYPLSANFRRQPTQSDIHAIHRMLARDLEDFRKPVESSDPAAALRRWQRPLSIAKLLCCAVDYGRNNKGRYLQFQKIEALYKELGLAQAKGKQVTGREIIAFDIALESVTEEVIAELNQQVEKELALLKKVNGNSMYSQGGSRGSKSGFHKQGPQETATAPQEQPVSEKKPPRTVLWYPSPVVSGGKSSEPIESVWSEIPGMEEKEKKEEEELESPFKSTYS